MHPSVGSLPGQLVPGPDADPTVLALYLLVGLVASLLAVVLLIWVGRIVYRLSKPALASLDRRLPVPVPTGATNRVLITIIVLVVAVLGGYAALDAAAPYVWYGKPLPGTADDGGGDTTRLVYEGDVLVRSVADPLEDDADGDRLPDAWERAGETPDGVSLPDADPQHKDLYVQLDRGATGRRLTASERESLRAVWAEMPVENPDGESGIRLHLVDGRDSDRLAQVTAAANADRFYTTERMGARRCHYAQVTLGQVAVSNTTQVSEAPGYAVVVDTGRRTAPVDVPWRVHAITHGLLHTVAGPAPDGSVHVSAGWLSVAPGRNDTHLAPATARSLSQDGFALPGGGSCSNATAA